MGVSIHKSWLFSDEDKTTKPRQQRRIHKGKSPGKSGLAPDNRYYSILTNRIADFNALNKAVLGSVVESRSNHTDLIVTPVF